VAETSEPEDRRAGMDASSFRASVVIGALLLVRHMMNPQEQAYTCFRAGVSSPSVLMSPVLALAITQLKYLATASVFNPVVQNYTLRMLAEDIYLGSSLSRLMCRKNS
jgi:hypothetical protein